MNPIKRALVALTAFTTLGLVLVAPAQASSREPIDHLVARVTANPALVKTLSASDVRRLREFGRFDHFDTQVVVGGQRITPDQPMNKALATITNSAITTAYAACYHHRAITYARNLVGYKLWAYWVEGTWCASSGQLTASARLDLTGGDTYYLWWSYEGSIAKGARVTYGTSPYSAWIEEPVARIWGEGKFQYAYKGTLQNRYPCLRINGYGDGYHRDDYRCSYYD